MTILIITLLLIFLCIVIVMLIMIQRTSGGMGSALGGGAADQVLGAGSAAQLTKNALAALDAPTEGEAFLERFKPAENAVEEVAVEELLEQ